jgi:hypothetical protein
MEKWRCNSTILALSTRWNSSASCPFCCIPSEIAHGTHCIAGHIEKKNSNLISFQIFGNVCSLKCWECPIYKLEGKMGEVP